MFTCQKDLDLNLPLVHSVTKDLNKALGVKTPWTLDVIYKTARSGGRYPKYSLLEDGLHPSALAAERLARQILKDVDEFFEEDLKVVYFKIPLIPRQRKSVVSTGLNNLPLSCESSSILTPGNPIDVNSSIPSLMLGNAVNNYDMRIVFYAAMTVLVSFEVIVSHLYFAYHCHVADCSGVMCCCVPVCDNRTERQLQCYHLAIRRKTTITSGAHRNSKPNIWNCLRILQPIIICVLLCALNLTHWDTSILYEIIGIRNILIFTEENAEATTSTTVCNKITGRSAVIPGIWCCIEYRVFGLYEPPCLFTTLS